jgi:flagellar biosynthesis protein FliQ
MTSGDVVSVLQQSLLTTLVVGGPIVLATLVVGLAVSVVQAATQLNESTMTFVPKLVVVALILVVLGPGMLQSLIDFTRLAFSAAARVAP